MHLLLVNKSPSRELQWKLSSFLLPLHDATIHLPHILSLTIRPTFIPDIDDEDGDVDNK